MNDLEDKLEDLILSIQAGLLDESEIIESLDELKIEVRELLKNGSKEV